MAIRTRQFFIRPAEFAETLNDVATLLGLHQVLLRFGAPAVLASTPLSPSVSMPDGHPADRIYLMSERPPPDMLEFRQRQPARWGWLSLDVPQELGDVLLMSELGAKSDWYDPDTGTVHENPASLELFRRVAPIFAKRLQRPVWAYNTITGRGQAYGDIGFSSGAADWIRQGRTLRQRAVANVAYSIQPLEDDRSAT